MLPKYVYETEILPTIQCELVILFGYERHLQIYLHGLLKLVKVGF
jgi:hypothetical protein